MDIALDWKLNSDKASIRREPDNGDFLKHGLLVFIESNCKLQKHRSRNNNSHKNKKPLLICDFF